MATDLRERSRHLLQEALRLGRTLVAQGRGPYAYAMYDALCTSRGSAADRLAPQEEALLRMRMCDIALGWAREASLRPVKNCIEELARLHARFSLSAEMVLRFTSLRIRACRHLDPGDPHKLLPLLDDAATEAKAFAKPRWARYFASLRALHTPLMGLATPGGSTHPLDAGAPQHASAREASHLLLNGSAPSRQTDPQDDELPEEQQSDTTTPQALPGAKRKRGVGRAVRGAVGELLTRYSAAAGGCKRARLEGGCVGRAAAEHRRQGKFPKGRLAEAMDDDGVYYPCTVQRGAYEGSCLIRFSGEESLRLLGSACMQRVEGMTQWELVGFPRQHGAEELASLSRALLWASQGKRRRALHAAEASVASLRRTASRQALSYAAEVALRLLSCHMQCAMLDAVSASASLLAAAGVATERGIAHLLHSIHLAAAPVLLLSGRPEAALEHLGVALRSLNPSVALCAAALRVTMTPPANRGRSGGLRHSLDAAWHDLRSKAVAWGDGDLPQVCRFAAEVAAMHGVDAARAMCLSAGGEDAEGPGGVELPEQEVRSEFADGSADAAHAAYWAAMHGVAAAGVGEVGAEDGSSGATPAPPAVLDALRAASAPSLCERGIELDLALRFPQAGGDGADGLPDALQRIPAPQPGVVAEIAAWLPGLPAYPTG